MKLIPTLTLLVSGSAVVLAGNPVNTFNSSIPTAPAPVPALSQSLPSAIQSSIPPAQGGLVSNSAWGQTTTPAPAQFQGPAATIGPIVTTPAMTGNMLPLQLPGNASGMGCASGNCGTSPAGSCATGGCATQPSAPLFQRLRDWAFYCPKPVYNTYKVGYQTAPVKQFYYYYRTPIGCEHGGCSPDMSPDRSRILNFNRVNSTPACTSPAIYQPAGCSIPTDLSVNAGTGPRVNQVPLTPASAGLWPHTETEDRPGFMRRLVTFLTPGFLADDMDSPSVNILPANSMFRPLNIKEMSTPAVMPASMTTPSVNLPIPGSPPMASTPFTKQ